MIHQEKGGVGRAETKLEKSQEVEPETRTELEIEAETEAGGEAGTEVGIGEIEAEKKNLIKFDPKGQRKNQIAGKETENGKCEDKHQVLHHESR